MSQVNINLNTNQVEINTTNNQIVVTDPINPSTVNITQPVTSIVEVITAGPQGSPGPQGPPGPSGSTVNTGSFVTTSSFNAFTSSYNTGSFTGSFTGSLFGTSSFSISSSTSISSSFATTSSFTVSSSRAISSSFATTASFAVSSSRALTASIADNTLGISSSITNNINNYLLTSTGGSTINGESNLTFDGILLSLGQTEAGRFQQGGTTSANGTGSHAEGQSTGANGDFSHAEGRRTTANGNYSHAEGYETIASGAYQHVQGQFNQTSPAESAFIIGNGIDTNNRSNLVFASGSQFQVTGSVTATQGFTSNWGTGSNKTALFGTNYPFGVNNRQILFNDISNNDFNYQSQSISILANVEEGFGVALGGDANGTPVSSNISTTLGSSTIENVEGTAFGKVQVYPDQLAITTDNNAYEQLIQLKSDNIKFLISNKTTTEFNTIELYTDRVYIKNHITTDQGFIGSYLQAPSITGSLLGTASFAVSSSRAISSSFATTSSFALNALTASFATSSSLSISSSIATTSSFVTASNVFGPFGSNSIASASFAATASYLQNQYNVKITTPTPPVSGTLSETQLLRLEIPPNSFAANDVLNIPSVMVSKVGTVASYSLRVKLSISSSMPTGSTDAIVTLSVGNTNVYTKLSRGYFISDGFLRGLGITNSLTDTINSTIALSVKSFDNTVTNYLYVSYQASSTADSYSLTGLQINNL